MTDTTLSLAARLAANLIVDAINLAKPGARLAGKIGDGALNLIGGSPFNEREAQRFLTMGGSERLAEAEAERDVYEPDPLWSAARVREQEENIGRAVHPLYREARYNTMPNWHASKSSAPVAPKPTDVAGSPGVASTPRDATPGHLTIWRKVSCPTCRAIAGLACEDDDGYRRPDVIHPTRIAAFDTRDATQTTTQARDPECGCAMTESSQANCPLHGYNGTLDNDETPEQPVGAGVAEPGTGGTLTVPPAASADQSTSALMRALIMQVRIWQRGKTIEQAGAGRAEYLCELIADADARADQHEAVGD